MTNCPKCGTKRDDAAKRCDCGHDFERAALHASAETGDAEAQYQLGLTFGYDDKNFVESVKWFRKAAGHGHPNAQSELGMRLITGQGLAEDVPAGLHWMRLAAENGSEHARFWLGLFYAEGSPKITQNYSEAVKYYRMAADEGEPFSQERLGYFYANGLGVPQDHRKALDWFRKSACQGFVKAQAGLGVVFYSGNGVPQNFSEAIGWFRRAAEQGHRGAEYMVGLMSFYGQGTQPNKSEAAGWLEKAAYQGMVEAQYMLARMFEKGDGVPKRLEKAVELYYMAAERGHVNAQAYIGLNLGRTGDYVECVKWLELSTRNGDPVLHEAKHMALRDIAQEAIIAGRRLAAEWKSKAEYDKIHPVTGEALTTYERTLKLAVEISAKEKPSATYCRFCGRQNDLRDRFCGNCGNILI